ncbi:MAG: hypothetical protein FJZ00_01875 [Candidatus Sericytochromatia bacterium]|uniref:Terminase large subunit gp17-like C-terminal domain-containing protein n=1 Tax=Candidatus Tanganyikabacteria bacterium TaxID=2961651 RepID=A0A938BM30_9BACT|nr:hypothetical protein [Candidatus Tanganyikabacteria bacterium]
MAVSERTREALDTIEKLASIETRREVLLKLKSDHDAWSWKAALDDPWWFMRHFCKTRNEHATTDDPYQPFPELDYLRHTLDVWQKVEARPANRILLVAKSRQMMVSWVACAMVLWNCLSKKGKRVGWQSKKSEDADQMLERIYGLYSRLPEAVRQAHPLERKEFLLRFPATDCNVHAIPQGPDQVRSYTWSLFVSDEMAFQKDDDEAYYALLPALGKVGMAVLISTAGPGHFEQLFADQIVAALR